MKKALITGGGGFVGSAIARELVKAGVVCVVAGRNEYPHLHRLGVECRQGDIRDKAFLQDCCRGVDTCFHVAALAGFWGKWQDYYSINVQGTENVLAACRRAGVERLVYTSTPSVVFAGKDIKGGDESLPHAKKFLCHYARSKSMAEKVVFSGGSSGPLVCAIRPHLVWGPGDPHILPRLLAQGRSGKLKRVGDGTNLVDISYVDNVAHGHVLAAGNLEGEKSCAGKSYFISQGEPVSIWQWINELFVRLGVEPVKRGVSLPVAYSIGAGLEWVYRLTGKSSEPPMTRFLAEQLGMSHYFSIAAAQKDFGYSPLVSTEEGINRVVNWMRSQ